MRNSFRFWISSLILFAVMSVSTETFSQSGRHPQADCLDNIAGSLGKSVVGCRLYASGENYCYYECNCSGSQSECDQIYGELGLIDV